MFETLLGTLFLAIPTLLVGLFLFWRNYKPVFWMLTGALVLGLGYLGVTGATRDIGEPLAEIFYGDTTTVTAPKKATTPTRSDDASMAAPATPAQPAGSASGTQTFVPSPDGRYVTQ